MSHFYEISFVKELNQPSFFWKVQYYGTRIFIKLADNNETHTKTACECCSLPSFKNLTLGIALDNGFIYYDRRWACRSAFVEIVY